VARAAVLGRLTWHVGEIVETISETPRVRSLVFSVPGWPGHHAGQHVDVRLTAEDGYQTARSYSIASPPEDSHVTLTIERLDSGEVSPFLVDDVRAGDKLELRGPIGGYFVWEESYGGPLFLVGGGSGIVPLMAMIRHRVARKSRVSVRLLESSRSPDNTIYRQELERLAAEQTGIEVIQTFTRSQPAGWTGYARRIDTEMLRETAPAPQERPLIYVCGPTQLVETVAESLVALGHDPGRVRTERFGPTGR
jgi:ferredoxin-NADP reductase